MKIIKLTAENVKKLTVVEITPGGNVVQITGKNGQGKTSVLDSIALALDQTMLSQKQPLRKGAEKGRIELQLGSQVVEAIVERRFTESGSTLTVRTVDGAKYSSPQKFLDALIGALALDPMAFMRQDARGQFDDLRGLVKLDVDLEAVDKANKIDFDERTNVNRDAKALRAQAAGIVIAPDLPAELIDESALLDAIQAGAKANTELEQAKAARIQAATDAETAETAGKSLRDQAAQVIGNAESEAARIIATAKTNADRLVKRADEAEQRANEIKGRLAVARPLPEPVDLSELRTHMNEAKATNLEIAKRAARIKIKERAVALETKVGALTDAMDKRKASKIEAIEKAKMPVDGLSFGDGTVLFNGLPLDQASDSEQLMVSTSIAAALNPKLRVLRIRDGSLLDDDAMARLATFATERDFQIWIERVDGSGTVGIVMEDGHVKGQEQKVMELEPNKAGK